MPDRVIRDELLESERWLGLRSPTERFCFKVLLLKVDVLGNFEAGLSRLCRGWAPCGVTSNEQAAGVLEDLVEADLVRIYVVGGKKYLHVPRFRQRLRYLKRLTAPPSPWTTPEQKQKLAANSPGDSPVQDRLAQAEVKRSEEVPTVPKGTSGTKNKIKGKTNGAIAPAWLPQKAWDDFVEFRKARRAPMTERAKELAIMKLDAMRKGGHDPAAILEQSVMNGWTSLVPVKEGVSTNGLTPAGQRTAENLKRWRKKEEAKDENPGS